METPIFKIKYQRATSSQTVTLTPSNCANYGYAPTNITVDNTTYTVYYKVGDDPSNIVPYSIVQGEAITEIIVYTYTNYEHIAPPNSKYTISYADVDKEGSGRNNQTGHMFRERVGYYMKLDIAWNLIPNSSEYNNWYKILTHLPPKIEIVMLTPDGQMTTINAYRGDIQTDLYYYEYNSTTLETTQIWQSLGTTFTQWDIIPYNDSSEPTILTT